MKLTSSLDWLVNLTFGLCSKTKESPSTKTRSEQTPKFEARANTPGTTTVGAGLMPRWTQIYTSERNLIFYYKCVRFPSHFHQPLASSCLLTQQRWSLISFYLKQSEVISGTAPCCFTCWERLDVLRCACAHDYSSTVEQRYKGTGSLSVLSLYLQKEVRTLIGISTPVSNSSVLPCAMKRGFGMEPQQPEVK